MFAMECLSQYSRALGPRSLEHRKAELPGYEVPKSWSSCISIPTNILKLFGLILTMEEGSSVSPRPGKRSHAEFEDEHKPTAANGTNGATAQDNGTSNSSLVAAHS